MWHLTKLYRREIAINEELRVIAWEQARLTIKHKIWWWRELPKTIFKATLEWMELGIRQQEIVIMWQVKKIFNRVSVH